MKNALIYVAISLIVIGFSFDITFFFGMAGAMFIGLAIAEYQEQRRETKLQAMKERIEADNIEFMRKHASHNWDLIKREDLDDDERE